MQETNCFECVVCSVSGAGAREADQKETGGYCECSHARAGEPESGEGGKMVDASQCTNKSTL